MTYTKEQARIEIAHLVETFQTYEARLRDEAEAQIENNYIRPLFRCLNWNTQNRGLAVADYEFVLQRTDRRGKRPDYVLQLDGQHLLVMDAKQVKYDMHDPRWMNQVYAYAYSTQNLAPSRKIDFAILTDFQEFLLLDCSLFAATPQAVGNFRVLDWKYADYVTHFDTLWELLERESVRQAARTRGTEAPAGLWGRALSPSKVKANRIKPDKAFLAAMDDDRTGWRVRLAKDMKKRNPQADGPLLTAAVQLWIDRLIFVKVLSDREIEDDYLAQLAETVERAGLDESDTGWFSACRAIFEKLNQFYDGSIFEPRPELEAVAVSNRVVRDILRALQPENSPYNFAVLPVAILGTIYERFLGRVVRTTEKQVRIEDKPEVRKAGGVYYTPQYIVDYIVQNTVGRLLEKCRTPEDVARLRILDPACGSGSFLLGAYAALIEWHVRYYGGKEQLTKKDRAAAYYDADGNVRLTARLKRQILLNNLYGVDIDPQAVEVTRFSLSLKALEDTRRDELYEERDLFKQTVLPDLRGNIKCGNSLIGSDYFGGQMFPAADELRRVNPFDWESGFPQVFQLPKSSETSEVSAGFDAVIGNPPYIRIQTMKEWAPLEVELYKKLYTAAGQGNYDIYVVFVERALGLLNERGRLGFILPHKFFNAQYGRPLRQLVAQGKHLAKVVHFGDQQVFAGATTYTCLLFLDKAGREEVAFEKVDDLSAWRATGEASHGTIPPANVSAAEWNFTVGEVAQLFERLSRMPIRLGDRASVFVGLQTSADRVYVLEETSPPVGGLVQVRDGNGVEWFLEVGALKPFLNDVTVSTYVRPISRHWLVFPYCLAEHQALLIPASEMASGYPRVWEYLKQNGDTLRRRESGKVDSDKWYGYIYRKNLTLFDSPKLIVQVISRFGRYAYDESGIYFAGGGNGPYYGVRWLDSADAHSIHYLQGLLGSRLLDFHLHRISSPFRGGYWSYGKRFIEQLPVRGIDFSDADDKTRHDRMVQLVEAMLVLHKHKATATTQAEQDLYQRQIEATDRQIDALVYELYGLTADEIAVVEEQG